MTATPSDKICDKWPACLKSCGFLDGGFKRCIEEVMKIEPRNNAGTAISPPAGELTGGEPTCPKTAETYTRQTERVKETSDWYISESGSYVVDWDEDPNRQLSIMLKPDGTVAFAIYANGERIHGNAMSQEFWRGLRLLLTQPVPNVKETGESLTRRAVTPDKYIAAAFYEAANEESAQTEWWKVCIDIQDRAKQLQQAEENPTRVKCSVCPAMMVNPAPCMRSDCGFRK